MGWGACCFLPPAWTVGISREQRRLLWLRDGDLPAGHTARDVPPPPQAQPRGLQRCGHTLPVGPAPSPAQLTRPAVW